MCWARLNLSFCDVIYLCLFLCCVMIQGLFLFLFLTFVLLAIGVYSFPVQQVGAIFGMIAAAFAILNPSARSKIGLMV